MLPEVEGIVEGVDDFGNRPEEEDDEEDEEDEEEDEDWVGGGGENDGGERFDGFVAGGCSSMMASQDKSSI
jgi:hypothetical protein